MAGEERFRLGKPFRTSRILSSSFLFSSDFRHATSIHFLEMIDYDLGDKAIDLRLTTHVKSGYVYEMLKCTMYLSRALVEAESEKSGPESLDSNGAFLNSTIDSFSVMLVSEKVMEGEGRKIEAEKTLSD